MTGRGRPADRGRASRCRLGARNSRQNGEHIAGHVANSADHGAAGIDRRREPGLSFAQGARMGRAYGKCRLIVKAAIARPSQLPPAP